MIKIWCNKSALPHGYGTVPDEAAFVFDTAELVILQKMLNAARGRVDISPAVNRVIAQMASEMCEIWQDSEHGE